MKITIEYDDINDVREEFLNILSISEKLTEEEYTKVMTCTTAGEIAETIFKPEEYTVYKEENKVEIIL